MLQNSLVQFPYFKIKFGNHIQMLLTSSSIWFLLHETKFSLKQVFFFASSVFQQRFRQHLFLLRKTKHTLAFNSTFNIGSMAEKQTCRTKIITLGVPREWVRLNVSLFLYRLRLFWLKLFLVNDQIRFYELI